MTDKRKHDDARREGDAAATRAGSGEQPRAEYQDIAGSEAAGQPDMNQDPLAGAMDQASAQTDTIEHAVEGDQGIPADHDPAGSGGPASRNTSAPAGEEVGRDEPTEGEK